MILQLIKNFFKKENPQDLKIVLCFSILLNLLLIYSLLVVNYQLDLLYGSIVLKQELISSIQDRNFLEVLH